MRFGGLDPIAGKPCKISCSLSGMSVNLYQIRFAHREYTSRNKKQGVFLLHYILESIKICP